MSKDCALPPRLRASIKASSIEAHVQHMFDAKTNVGHSSNLIRLVTVKQLDEPGPATARAVDMVLRNPR